MKKNEILITGANGFIGKKLAICLSQENFLVTAIVRKKKWENDKIKFIESDLLVHNLSDKVNFKKFDIIIHAAAYLGMHEKNKQLFQGNYIITKNILDSISNPNTFFIYLSSIDAFGPTKNKKVTENDEPFPVTDYGKIKLKTERLIMRKSKSYSILRLGNVIDGEEGFLAGMKKITQKNDLYSKIQSLIFERIIGDYEINLISIDSIINYILKIIKKRPANKIFFLTEKRLTIYQALFNHSPKKQLWIGKIIILIICKILSLLKISHIICYLTQGGIKRRHRNYSLQSIKNI